MLSSPGPNLVFSPPPYANCSFPTTLYLMAYLIRPMPSQVQVAYETRLPVPGDRPSRGPLLGCPHVPIPGAESGRRHAACTCAYARVRTSAYVSACTCAYARVRTSAYVSGCTSAYARVRTSAYASGCTSAYVSACTCAYASACTCAYFSACTCAYASACTCAYASACTSAYVSACTCAYASGCTSAYVSACTCAYASGCTSAYVSACTRAYALHSGLLGGQRHIAGGAAGVRSAVWRRRRGQRLY
jgi:hypothetical protein